MSATSRAGRAMAGGATVPPAPYCPASYACGAARSGPQGAFDLGNHSGRHAGVAGRRLQPLVSEQRLNDANVPAALEQMSREAVTKRMQRERLAQPRGFLEQPAELTRDQRLMITATWKQPALF